MEWRDSDLGITPDIAQDIADVMRSEIRSKTRIGDQHMEIVVAGLEETQANVRNYMNAALFFTSFISYKSAKIVLEESKKHVPWDTGFLTRSAWGPRRTETALEHKIGKYTVISSNVEGWDYEGQLPESLTSVSAFWALQGPGKSITKIPKWSVGYSADYAAEVHENSREVTFRQPDDIDNPPSAPFLYPDPKWDHFLSQALEKFKGQMEPEMWEALDMLNVVLDVKLKNMMQSAEQAAKPTLAPRLVKRT